MLIGLWAEDRGKSESQPIIEVDAHLGGGKLAFLVETIVLI